MKDSQIVNILLTTLALLLVSAGMQAQDYVAINATNFPDANFRAYVIATFDKYPTDGKLSLSERTSVKKMYMSSRNIASLKGIEYFPEATLVNVPYNKLTELDLTANKKLEEVNCGNNSIVSVNVSGCSALKKLYCSNNKLTSMNLTGCSALTDLDCSVNDLTELDVSDCVSLINVTCGTNYLKDLDLTNNLNVEKISCSENLLDQIEVHHLTKLTRLIAHRCGLTDHDYDVSNHTQMQQLQINGGYYIRNGNILKEPTMRVASVDVAHMKDLEILLCQKELLSTLDLSNNEKVTYVQLERNRLLTLDLGMLTLRTKHATTSLVCNSSMKGQKSVEDVVVLDHEKVALYLPNGCPEKYRFGNTFIVDGKTISQNDRELIKRDGKDYLVFFKSATKDIDLYGKTIYYLYNTKWKIIDDYNGSSAINEGNSYMDVTVTAYPYIMYISPNSKSTNSDFYSGTICLDYDAIVPEGVTAWVATGIKSYRAINNDENANGVVELQLTMQKVADAGQAIPANTPVFIKADNNAVAGLYAFNKNWQPAFTGWTGANGRYDSDRLLYDEVGQKPLVSIPTNILKGTLTDMPVKPMTVLTLGHEDSSGTKGEMGFWRFTGTAVPAHRCYIPISELGEEVTSGTRGVTLSFAE